MAQPFFGRYVCPLDEKSRAVLPLRLREAIEGEVLREGFVITQGFDGSLLMFTKAGWRDEMKRYENLRYTDPDALAFMRYFYSYAQEVAIDRIGRVTIADFQKEMAGIGREVVFHGQKDHIEIWSPEKWEKWNGENAGDFKKVAARLDREIAARPVPQVPPAPPALPPAPAGEGWPPPGNGG